MEKSNRSPYDKLRDAYNNRTGLRLDSIEVQDLVEMDDALMSAVTQRYAGDDDDSKGGNSNEVSRT